MSSRKQLQEDETFAHCPLYNYKGVIYLKGRIEAGCSQEAVSYTHLTLPTNI